MSARIDNKEINSNNYQLPSGNSTQYEFKIDWLSIQRNGELLTLTADPNPKAEARTFSLSLWCTGNNGITITGTQQGH